MASLPRAGTRGARCTIVALSLLGALALTPTDSGAADSAAAVTTRRPAIVSISLWGPGPGNAPLPASGAPITIKAHIRHATKCKFLRQHSPSSGLYVFKTVKCSSGHAQATAPPIANHSYTTVYLTYAVRAYGGGSHSVQKSETLVENAAKPPIPKPTAALSLSPTSVLWTGGSVALRFSAKNATSCSLTSAPIVWTGSNPMSVSCNGTYTASVGPTSTKRSWTFTFTANDASGHSASEKQTLTELPPGEISDNWSGYIVPSSSALFADVSAEWTVPELDCAVTPNAERAIWVGIGGVDWPTGGSSGTLLRTGISMECVNGSPQYAGWFEEYPSNPNNLIDFTGFAVSAGDSIEAWVFQGSNGSWETRVDDLTTGLSGVMVTGAGWGVMTDGSSTFTNQGSTAGLSYSGGYTAEWVVEAPAIGGSIVQLVDYGTVTFSNLTTSLPSWSLTDDESVALEQNGTVVSTPSPPGTDGFSVSYTGETS